MIKFTDAQSYLIEYCNMKLEAKPIEQTQHRYICPFCGSGTNKDAAFTIVKKSNGKAFKCFSCGKYGDVFNLIQDIENLPTIGDALTSFENTFNVKIDKRTLPKAAKQTKGGAKHPIDADSGTPTHKDIFENSTFQSDYIEQGIKNLFGCKWALDHLHARGFTDATIKQFKIGYFKSDNRIILPFPNSESVLRYNPMMQPKYYAAGVKNTDIYNVDILKQKKPTFVCEGIFDALSIQQCGFNAIAILGTGNAKHLVDYIIQQDIHTPLILILDADAEKRQNELFNILYDLKMQIVVSCNAPMMMRKYNPKIKDPNDCMRLNANTFIKLLKRNYDFVEQKQCCIKVNFAIDTKKESQ